LNCRVPVQWRGNDLSQELQRTRIDIVEGDVFKSSPPGDHDVVLVANLVYMFTPAHNVELLTRIRAMAQTGARLLLVVFWPDSSYNEAAALMSGEFLLISGDGQTYSEQETDGMAQADQMAQARAQAAVRADQPDCRGATGNRSAVAATLRS
jgi:hypothetical protein